MAKYPDISIGQRITADLLDSMQPDVVRKTGDTPRLSTTAPADDPDLVMTIPANAWGLLEFWVKYSSLDSAKFKTAWNCVNITSANRQVLGLGSTANDTNADNIAMRAGVHAFTTTAVFGTRNSVSNQMWQLEWSLVTADTSDATVAFQWSQAASIASNTTVYSGSFARFTRYG